MPDCALGLQSTGMLGCVGWQQPILVVSLKFSIVN